MKRILAIDTSSWWGGLALVEQDDDGPRPVAEIGIHVRDSHANRVLGWLESLLAEAGWGRGDVDAYVAVRGPGRFTGVRVALGVVRGLSLATERPAVGIDSLDAIVEAYGPAERERVALVGAGRGEVYAARYDAGSSPVSRLKGPWIGLPETVLQTGGGGVVVVCGPGSEASAEDLPRGVEAFRIVPAPRSVASAAGRLALLRGIDRNDSDLVPLYIRPPDARVQKRPR